MDSGVVLVQLLLCRVTRTTIDTLKGGEAAHYRYEH